MGMSRTLIAGVSMSLSLGAQAAADPSTLLGRASMHVSALTYRLVDLAPDDGISPWILFDADTRARLIASEQDGGGWLTLPVHPFGPGPVQQVGDPSTHHATHAADGSFRTFTEVRLEDIAGQSQFSRSAAVSSDTGRIEQPQNWGWVVSPFTALEISATVTTSWAQDMGVLVGSELVSGPDRLYDFIAMSAGALLSAHLGFGESVPSSDPGASFRTGSSTSVQLRGDGLIIHSQQDPLAEQFTLALANTANYARRGHIHLDAGGGVQVQTMAPGVPEPAGAVLALSGLALIGWFSKPGRRARGEC